MNRMKSILVGVDFSSSSRTALQQALRIAEWNRAQVRVVHILDTMVMADVEFAMAAFHPNIHESMIADAREAWANFSADIPGAQAAAFEVLAAHPVAGLLDLVHEQKPDLLVLGLVGSGAGPGPGTVAAAAVRRARAKTLLVRESHSGPYKKIVVGVDFSETSITALQSAVRVAEQDGAALHVVHVFEAPWHRLHYKSPTPQASKDFQDQFTRALQQRLENVGDSAGLERELAYLKPVNRLIENSSHGKGLIEYARSVGSDLVVIGTRGRSNIRDMIMGSTAERVVRDAPCSVLAVKPAGFDDAETRA